MRPNTSLILISLSLAFIFNFLFFDKLVGLSVLLFTLTLLGTTFWLPLRHSFPWRKTFWLVMLLFFFALMPSIRDNQFLTFLNICATLGLLMLLARELTHPPVFLMNLRDYFFLVVLTPWQMLGSALTTVKAVGQVHSANKRHEQWLRVAKGGILALPVLVLFALLFSHADFLFAQFIRGFIDITITERTVQYLILLLFAFVAALSFLSYLLLAPSLPKPLSAKPAATHSPGATIEVLVFLVLIATLFLLFIGFQIAYLFGGETNIAATGYTYAEYARRGFFELLAVALLSLLILIVSEKYSGSEGKRNPAFLFPALFLITEVGIIIASASKRLSLYIEAYGLTALRFYVASFIALLLALFILLLIKFIFSRREEFLVFGTLLALALFLVIINLVNPDAFIIKSNLQKYSQTGKVDVFYLRELSADAVPGMLELSPKLTGENKQVLNDLLRDKKNYLLRHRLAWQSANLSRSQALRLLQAEEN